MPKRAAQGSGSIRQRKDGTWEARCTLGRDPGTGKQVRKSIYGKTQQEVRKKLSSIISESDLGIYKEPVNLTYGEWLEIWLSEYCGAIKPLTLDLYRKTAETRITPFLGKIALPKLTPVILQKYYNDSIKGNLKGLAAASPKTVRNVHGIIRKSLQQALMIGHIKTNPADMCILPKVTKKEMHVLDENHTKIFLKAIENYSFRRLFLVALFTGMREGELLGLSWDSIDFKKGTIHIFQQLQRHDGEYKLFSPKNGKPRTISPASHVMQLLLEEKTEQSKKRLKAGVLWDNKNHLVFTSDDGKHLNQQWVYKRFKRAVNSIGLNDIRFHDLRHSYAVAALRAGIDVKTVSMNLGHATVAFTLDVYGHVTESMRQESASKMQNYINSLKA